MATGGHDGQVKLWDITSGDCIAAVMFQAVPFHEVLRPDRLYEGMNITGITGLSDGQKAALQQLGAVVNGGV
jgi:WD40 repeat protein